MRAEGAAVCPAPCGWWDNVSWRWLWEAMALSLASMAFYRGLCPEDVAAASGLPTKTVDGILNGDVSLSSQQWALGRAFGLSRDGLLEAERRRESARLPQSLLRHFWDTRFDALDRKANQDQIVTRLLERAGTEGLRWVIYAYSPSKLRETARRTRRLTPVTANFLRETLGLSRDEMAYYRVRHLERWR